MPFRKQAGSIFGFGYEINDKAGYGSENNLFGSITPNLRLMQGVWLNSKLPYLEYRCQDARISSGQGNVAPR